MGIKECAGARCIRLRFVKGRQAVVVAMFVSWLGMALSPNALAQQGSGAASTESVQAEQVRQLYKEGVKEATRGRWEKARDLFLEAFRRKPDFQIAFNLGQAELKVGQHVEAAEHLALFLREAQGVREEERRKAQTMLDEAERHVATLVISTNHQGAEVLVDGASIGTSPLGREIFVLPGQHVIQARLGGFRSARDERTFIAADHLQVELKLTKVAETPAPAVPSAALGKPDSTEESGAAPYRKWVIGAGASTAVAAMTVGIVFTLKANASMLDAQYKTDEIVAIGDGPNSPLPSPRTPYCNAGYIKKQCDELHQLLLGYYTHKNVAIAGYVVSGAAAVGTLAFAYLSRPKPQRTTSLQITPIGFSLREKGGGLLLSGAF
jgi:hypothetical protein